MSSMPIPTTPETAERAEWRKTKTEERSLLLSTFGSDNLHWGNVDWTVVGWMTAMHLGALVAVVSLFTPYRSMFFNWQSLAVCVVLHWMTCSIGICMTMHRYLSHRSLKLRTPAKAFGLFCATVAGEGTPLHWSAIHRIHHQKSDQPGDPHSPNEGDWWSHILWTFTGRDSRLNPTMYKHFVPDLVQDKMMWFFEKAFGPILVGTGIVLFLIGGWPMFLWGMCARLVFAYHSTWFVNSATHMWGYRTYETTDRSRNLWWVAVLAYGEGWHNNHHAYPRLARAGHKWWEVDPTWMFIRFLEMIGQAYEVDGRLPEQLPASKATGDALQQLRGHSQQVPPVEAA